MSIAREAGQRSKVAVMARQEGIDAVGACVGMRGIRIQNIVKELNDEKIDIIEWDADPSRYIARALSPARVSKVILEEDLDNIRTATVIVPEDQLSQAIGKEGQNARLAAKLTGWRIDIKSVVEAAQQNLEKVEDYPLSDLLGTHPELLTDAYRILAKRADNRVVTPEEYSVLKQFVDLAETRLYEHREHARRERREMIEAVRPLVPAAAFHMPLKELELAPDIMAVIERLVNVGELWVRFMADETGLATMLAEGKAGSDAMEAIGYALDDLVIPEVYEEEAAQAAAQAEAEAASAPAPGEVATSDSEADISLPDPTDEAGEVSPERYKKAEDETDPDYESYLEVEEEEDSDIDSLAKKDSQNKKKKSKQKRRQLVYDEEVGEVVAKRRRKRSGDGDDYDEFL
jgi:N utilization substance protein A